MRSRLRLVPVALLVMLYACASQRLAVEPESALQRQLGFIRSNEANRAQVQARLGDPVWVYESGRIVSYALYWHDEHFTQHDLPVGNCYGLVIEYAADGRIARYALIRMGSNLCRH